LPFAASARFALRTATNIAALKAATTNNVIALTRMAHTPAATSSAVATNRTLTFNTR
jgi:hypothetical protein